MQSRFADLLGVLALETDVHVLLSMRDDFLFHCHKYPSLLPIFSELTPLGPPSGAALRRAVVQPTLACGYHFEDESLVDEILDQVGEERGALPLLAFAMASLWERRDRESGSLKREAYASVGGVGGALAKHAETTLERIGNDGQLVVREMFRNLVTAQGTRAERGVDELLSVFEDRAVAEAALKQLVDARLLTSFEVHSRADANEATGQRVEIIHESLLSRWPRLVRWQAQDVEGAQLRDQLRQTAQMWAEREHPDDLLWTGTAFQEFELWRERYSGGLTPDEEEYARAMHELADRRRKRRQRIAGGVLVSLLAILAVVGALWRQSVEETKNALARTLFSLGQQHPERHDTTTRIAYAIASLELRDDPAVRRFAHTALWRGPAAFLLPNQTNAMMWDAGFHPDGSHLVVNQAVYDAPSEVWARDGGTPRVVDYSEGAALRGLPPLCAELYSRTRSDVHAVSRHRFAVTQSDSAEGWAFEVWPLVGEDAPSSGKRYVQARSPITRTATQGVRGADVDSSGKWVAYANGRVLEVVALDNLAAAVGQRIGSHEDDILGVAVDPEGERIASVDALGEVRIWSRDWPDRLLGRFMGPSQVFGALRFQPDGTGLGLPTRLGNAILWDLEEAPSMDPLVLGWSTSQMSWFEFSSDGRWAVTTNSVGAAIWPMNQPFSRVLRADGDPIFYRGLVFTPDGRHLVSVSEQGTVRHWSLSSTEQEASRVLFGGQGLVFGLGTDPAGRFLLVMGRFGVRLINLESGVVEEIPIDSQGASPHTGAVDPQGRYVAIGAGTMAANDLVQKRDDPRLRPADERDVVVRHSR